MRAGAGTVVVYSRSLDGGATLVVRGAEVANDIRIALSGGSFTVIDSPRPDPGRERHRLRPDRLRRATCPADASFILVDADGGDDRVAIDGSVPASVEARLEGGPGADELFGGNGGDVLEAGDDCDPDTPRRRRRRRRPGRRPHRQPRALLDSGKSIFIGGQGADVMVGGDPCDGDVFDGGPGNDNANFFRFTPGVKAQIGGAVSRDGGGCTPGRIDRSVEALEGSPGPDVMIGSSAGDSLIGKGGDDQLFGMAGNDILSGGPGNDRLVGGPGRDSEHQ